MRSHGKISPRSYKSKETEEPIVLLEKQDEQGPSKAASSQGIVREKRTLSKCRAVQPMHRNNKTVVVLEDDESLSADIIHRQSSSGSPPNPKNSEVEVVGFKRNKRRISVDEEAVQIVAINRRTRSSAEIQASNQSGQRFAAAVSQLHRQLHSIPNVQPSTSDKFQSTTNKVSASAALAEHFFGGQAKNPTVPAVFRCTICLAEPEKETSLSSTTCGHIFCSSCIEANLKHNGSCPICRKRLTRKAIHRIFLGTWITRLSNQHVFYNHCSRHSLANTVNLLNIGFESFVKQILKVNSCLEGWI